MILPKEKTSHLFSRGEFYARNIVLQQQTVKKVFFVNNS